MSDNILSKKHLFILLIFTFLIGGIFSSGYAKDKGEFPTKKPIRIINPYSPGGSTDRALRIIGSVIPEILNTQLRVASMKGAAGAEAWRYVSGQTPDGYTLMATGFTNQIMLPALGDAPYDVDSLVPVAQFVKVGVCLAVSPKSPFQTMQEFMNYAKSHPGKLSIGYTPFGTNHTAVLVLSRKMGIQFALIPTHGSGERIMDVMGGHLDACAINVSEAAPLQDAGKLKTLIVFKDGGRHKSLPEVPTTEEIGLSGLAVSTGIWVCAHVKTPKERLIILEKGIKEATEHPSAVALSKKVGQPFTYKGRKDSEKEITRLRAIAASLKDVFEKAKKK